MLPINKTFRGLKNVFASEQLILPPVTDGLKIWLELDEGAGQVASDKSGNGNNGMLGTTAGADSNDPVWVPGGLQLVNDDLVQCPHQEFTTFTYIIVAKFNTPTNTAAIMGQINKNYHGPTMYLYLDSMRIIWVGNEWWDTITDDYTVIAGQNQMITVAYDGTNIKGYIGDSLSLTKAATSAQIFASGTGPMCIGGVVTPDANIWSTADLSVYYAMVYDVALTAQEIADTYAFIQARLAAKGVTLP